MQQNKKREKEIKKICKMTISELVKYYRKHHICNYYPICPWKYVSLYYCQKEKGAFYNYCERRKAFEKTENFYISMLDSLEEVNKKLEEKAKTEYNREMEGNL